MRVGLTPFNCHRDAVRALIVALVLMASASAPVVHAQNGDALKGRQIFETRCGGCHSLDTDRVGPALRTVWGRVAGKAASFGYSSALSQASHVWTTEKLLAWLTNPEALMPGQAMGYSLEQADDRRDVVAYLALQAQAGR